MIFHTAELLALDVNSGVPVIYTPFMAEANIETLEVLPAATDNITLIEEREGVPYINQVILGLDTGAEADKELNRDFKELVDSVISVD